MAVAMYFIFVSASGTGGNAAPAGAVARATIFSCDHYVLERSMSVDQPTAFEYSKYLLYMSCKPLKHKVLQLSFVQLASVLSTARSLY